MGKVLYLTGAPATGKSTLAEHLARHAPSFQAFIYSQQLLNHVRQRDTSVSSQDDLRHLSAGIITPDDVTAVDRKLVELVSQRNSQSIVIDSHAVTKEIYGFRVTPFSQVALSMLSLDLIICLYADADVIRKRIARNSQGRPLITTSEAEFHTHAQAAVAINYATQLGKPLYFLDSSYPTEQLAKSVMSLVGIAPTSGVLP